MNLTEHQAAILARIEQTKLPERTRAHDSRRGGVCGNNNKASNSIDDRYRAWIQTLPCLVCSLKLYHGTVWLFTEDAGLIFEAAELSRRAQSECAHVGIRGLSQKSDDRETVPLCARHHRTGRDAQHVLGKWFWAYHDLDREGIIQALNSAYDRT